MNKDKNNKDYEGSAVFPFVCIIFIIFAVCIMVCKHETDRYTIELTADRISEVNLNDDRVLIGYADTTHGTAKVYDSLQKAFMYVGTYQYEYNDVTYTFMYRSCYPTRESMRLYINESNPEDFCFAEQKVSWKELMLH